MAWLDVVLDNPILTKHARARLRRSQLMPGAVIVLMLCVTICWGGITAYYKAVGALGLIVALQAVILLIAATQQIAVSVGGGRASGILEFHRVSPVPPAEVALGYWLGAPIREWLMFGLTLPFAIACAAMAEIGVLGFLQVEVPLVLGALLFHCLGLLASLMARKPKVAGGSGVVGFGIMVLFLGMPSAALLYRSASLLGDPDKGLGFFGVDVPWLWMVAAYLLVGIALLFLASARKMAAERAHAYTKPQAVGVMAIASTLFLGAIWGQKTANWTTLATVYALAFASMVLSVTITPDGAEFIKGLRRSARAGRRWSPFAADSADNRVALFTLCGLLALAATACWEMVELRQPGGLRTYSQSIAVGVFAAATFGLGLQYFLLKGPKNGPTMFGLFLFVAWVMPLVAGFVLVLADVPEATYSIVLSLSPIAGIAASSGLGTDSGTNWSGLAALVPSITFAFVFNFLLVNAIRRVERLVRKTAAEDPSLAAKAMPLLA